MNIVLVDLHILNTYHAHTYKEKLALLPVSKHPTIRGCFVFKNRIGPIRIQEEMQQHL